MKIMTVKEALAHYREVVSKLPDEARAEFSNVEIRIQHDWPMLAGAFALGACVMGMLWMTVR